MKYYNITVNGVAYSVSVEETAAGAAPVAAAAPAAPGRGCRAVVILPVDKGGNHGLSSSDRR